LAVFNLPVNVNLVRAQINLVAKHNVLGRKALRRITQPVLAPEVTFQLEVSFVVLVVPSLRIIYIIVYRINVSGLNFVNEKTPTVHRKEKKTKKDESNA
tara:strand:- start:258 stop:554 length:297 start_codon:yes stop_codon:yes gene_type:complete